jgi:hypothetical protein
MADGGSGFTVRMGRRIVYCEACGLRLCEDDFSVGKAALHLFRPFCVPCRPLPAVVVEEPARRVDRFTRRAGLPLRRPPATL